MKKFLLIALSFCLKQLNAQCYVYNSGGPNVAVCNGDTATLTANGATNYTWMPSGVNTTTIAIMPTTSTVYTLTGTTGTCTATYTVAVTVNPNPIAKFNYTPHVCDGSPMYFTGLSAVSGNATINSQQWDFNNDGSIDAMGQNPQYIYPNSGAELVKLIVSTNSTPSCTAQVTEVVFVNPKPVADFVGANLVGCSPLQVSFSDMSTVAQGQIYSWNWNFGNGQTTQYSYPPTQTYYNTSTTQDAYYSVSLTVMSDSGCVSTITKTHYIDVTACASNGIEKYASSTEIIIYPNPAQTNFVIEITSTDKQTLQILDVTGKLILQQTITGKANIDASSLDNGIYFVQINTSEGLLTKKIIVQK